MSIHSAAPVSRKNGFTLIEVLAALVIISLGMLGAIEAVNQTINNADYIRQRSIAHWVAMNQMTILRLSGNVRAGTKSSGEVTMAGTQWHWSTEIIATEAAGMVRINVDVRAADADDTDDADKDNTLATLSSFYSAAIAVGSWTGDVWDITPTGPGGVGPGPGANPNGNTNNNNNNGGNLDDGESQPN